ncbi:hypothetical protein [Sorangium sp. So ce1097]|uniref:hypothetical protein n=1 Tax=Sorangium sp. So ce1097 TaxID=3133330 RepID=UPI003F62D4F8
MSAPDRRDKIAAQHVVTGIDFVYVHPGQESLDVFFLTDPLALTAPLASLTAAQVRIHAEVLPNVEIVSMAWAVSDGRNVLRLTTAAPGGFVPYRLTIDDARIDPFFNHVEFSFKATCPSPFDCEPPPRECSHEPGVDFPVDTLARDFWSFRTALLDFAAQRYPDYKDRLEADVGVMLAEIMSHLGDEMAYYQDRVGREASLESATQRRSLRRHARLVDYVIHDGLGAAGWIDVQASAPGNLPAGVLLWADSDSGTIVNGVFLPRRIYFEVGRGLGEAVAGETYAVDPARNVLLPHIWDESATCLEVGATETWIDGHHAADLPLDDTPPGRPPGRWMILRTDPSDPSLPARRHLVRVIQVIDETDPLAGVLGTNPDVTRLVWERAQALPFDMDLQASFTVRANVVPITAGKSRTAQFSIGPSSLEGVPRAVERTGPNGSVAFLFTLADPDGDGLVHLSDSGDPRSARPEVHLTEATHVAPGFVAGEAWDWRRSLLGVQSSQPSDTHFTLDDGTWARTVGYQRLGGEVVQVDYLSGAGFSVRFGDGEFGRAPDKGSGLPADDKLFQVTWRVGNGKRGNVPAGSITTWRGKDPTDRKDPPLPSDPSLSFVDAISNPLPTAGGVEPETAADVKKLAPDAFRAVTYRAVIPEDYAEAAERAVDEDGRAWVQRAGASFRWTGSWLSAFVTADPIGAPELTDARKRQLGRWVDRFRQTGREVILRAPKYADIDLIVKICVEPSSYPGDVLAAVLVALFGKGGVRPTPGFFDPDNFTFGTTLDRSKLEAAIQRVPGVRAVEWMKIRRRGWFDWRAFKELFYRPAIDEVIRLENDPLHPERGAIRLIPEGGA